MLQYKCIQHVVSVVIVRGKQLRHVSLFGGKFAVSFFGFTRCYYVANELRCFLCCPCRGGCGCWRRSLHSACRAVLPCKFAVVAAGWLARLCLCARLPAAAALLWPLGKMVAASLAWPWQAAGGARKRTYGDSGGSQMEVSWLHTSRCLSVLHTAYLSVLAVAHIHPFNGPLSETTRVSRYQKGKTNLDSTEARDWVAVASAGPYASLHLAPDR